MKRGTELAVVELDLATPDGPNALIAEAVALHGGLDVLVNNVGAVRPRVDGFLSVTDEDWDWTFTVNFMAAVRTTRAALPHLLATGAGRVVTVSSVNGRLPDPLVIDYSAARAALTSFCKALSKEVGSRGVRVNTVSPGPVETARWQRAGGVAATVGQSRGVDPREVARGAADQSVTGRFTQPSEVADLVPYLAAPSAVNITGADFVIDGTSSNRSDPPSRCGRHRSRRSSQRPLRRELGEISELPPARIPPPGGRGLRAGRRPRGDHRHGRGQLAWSRLLFGEWLSRRRRRAPVGPDPAGTPRGDPGQRRG
ncbi:SDR family NAD(P)-dependent oxidoreductase [Streptomyces griseorubiginosus]|uniref:SDR family NAD(P)-dependent oxidoreductase n=1 Tax=Streptomyces griseorubiginosus TaxID=67304 RepID=UPI003666A362